MEPVQVRVPDAWRGLGHAELRQKMAEELDRMVREKVEINHPELGMIRVGRAGAKKSQSTSRDPAKALVAANLENVLPAAFHARSDAPDTKEQGVHGYSTLLGRVDIDGSELIASFSVRQQQDGAWYYNTVTLKDMQNKTPVASPRDTPIAGERATSANTGVSKEKAQDSYGSPGALSRPLGETPIAGLSDFIRRPLARVNPEAVSKVVDSATGEPLVVYHGTGKDCTEFQEGKRQSQYGGGLYFGRDPKVASSFASPLRGPAPNVMPVYLSLQNPFIETGDYKQTRTNQNKRNSVKSLNFLVNFGPPDRARTCYLLLRRQLLYPDELQADDLKNKPWYLRKVAGFIGCFGAGERNRTLDLLITKP